MNLELPTNYEEALAEATGRRKRDRRESGIRVLPVVDGRGPRAVTIVTLDEIPLVTFYADGRIKLCTFGTNDLLSIGRINAALPKPYRVRQSGSHHISLVKTHCSTPVATFLSSITFSPKLKEA